MKRIFRSFFCLISLVTFLSPIISDANIIPSSHLINSGTYYYNPNNLTVNVGDTVTWFNDGGLHDVNGDINSLTGSSYNNPVSFYLNPINGPAVIGSYIFTVPGTYNYDCSIGNHAANGMIGTIIVIANPGCTDPTAVNYDPNATIDDGSCIYCNNAAISDTFHSIGSMQSFVVPNGVTYIEVDAYGAQGGYSTGGIAGGLGGWTSAGFSVAPGETLYVFVGGQGETVATGIASGGFNGGGNSGDCSGNYAGSGGGGATDIRRGGTDLTDRIIVAGGGGGTHDINGNPGAGGGLNGGDVGSTGNGCFSLYATGGTQVTGGTDATSSGGCCTGMAGTGGLFGVGGDGQGPAVSCNNGDSGAGGGGGYYGGGSGFVYGSGGGGSSYTDPSALAVSHSQGDQFGDGKLVIHYTPTCDGCTDPSAINYDPAALIDDGSCCYVSGCTDPIANNYDPSIGAGCDDGSCTYNYGCTDPDANNYDPNATMDDGSCINCNNAASAVDTFNFTGNLQTYTVPSGITTLIIEAYGAEGGSGGSANFSPGKGAYIKGDVTVSPGDVIDILVGERGYDAIAAGGGGGGSFVVLQNGNIPLVIAGGGSGSTGQSIGHDGEIGEDGGEGDSCPGSGGTGGNGGGDANNCGGGAGGGGGFYSDGGSNGNWASQTYGGGYLNGGFGGNSPTNDAYGGYGGGAGTHSNNTGGGAGGGYSGGGAPNHGNGYSGGGGGSYNLGTNQTAISGSQLGDGLVLISYNLSIPECGCMDSTALNYDPVAIYEDSSCCYNYGCTDLTAVNYDPAADCDDGSCCYEGCTDPVAYNYEISACVDDGSCCYVTGCTDPASINYDPLACVDDGSCCILAGCTDMMAFNWDPFADCDDGSCCYVAGCTDPSATNYNPFACYDDFTCVYTCSVEINNGAVDVEMCEGDSAYLFATPIGGIPPYSYLWYDASTGNLLGTTNAILTWNPGVYLVEMQDAFGCIAIDDVSVLFFPSPSLNPVTVPNPPMICLGDQLVIEVNTGFVDYQWNTGNPLDQGQNTVVVYPTQDFTYVIEAIDIYQCESREEIQVFVDTCITAISDINNDLIQIYPNPASSEFFIKLYDSKIYDIELVDVIGRLMAKEEKVQKMIAIKTTDFADGTYFIRIKSDLSVSSHKIVIEK